MIYTCSKLPNTIFLLQRDFSLASKIIQILDPQFSCCAHSWKIPIRIIGTIYIDCLNKLMEQDTKYLFYLPMTCTSSSGTWTEILLCIQTLIAIPVAVWPTEQGCPWLFPGQELNTHSSMESKLFGVDDMSTMISWTKIFMEAKGYDIRKNILYQDKKSTI